MTIIPLPKQDPEPHDADLVTMDVLVDEALVCIGNLRTHLIDTLNTGTIPDELMAKSFKTLVDVEIFRHQFEEPAEYFGDAG
ncbi:MAG: hypothetical protein CL607_15120 [Anaerolineaceae bacterium]|nr:hypothetical protein [Anaerolineaceae bacterium]